VGTVAGPPALTGRPAADRGRNRIRGERRPDPRRLAAFIAHPRRSGVGKNCGGHKPSPRAGAPV